MQPPRDLKGYKKELHDALNNEFLRRAMDSFAVAYRQSRRNAFAGLDLEALIREVGQAKDRALDRLPQLYQEFKEKAEKTGVRVHLAVDADEANRIIADIALQAGAEKIIKSKSMTAEETGLNHYLEKQNLEVTETDLGEWIIQLRGEGPSHMVMPAIHLSRYQVADLFSEVTRTRQTVEIERLVKVARRELRRKFVEADLGITGANFAVAETGTIGLVTNEGNARLVSTLPRIHVALVGLEKLTPTLHDALKVIEVLPRNATGQAITSYVTWITGPVEYQGEPQGPKEMHVVFLDNGRLALSRDPVFSQVLRCVRCGACANVCPVYRLVGGHHYGHIYIGAIGLILTYLFHGPRNAEALVQNCISCGACGDVCSAGIDLPRIIKEIHTRLHSRVRAPNPDSLLARVLQDRRLFHSMLRSAKLFQRPVTGGTPYLRHLPHLFFKEHRFRVLPALAARPFRELWPEIKPEFKHPRLRVALFAGCVQDFVYPEQLAAAVKIMASQGVDVVFPYGQSCCGLPVESMGEKEAAAKVALHNLEAIDPDRYDYIVTCCGSCASHLKNRYPALAPPEKDVADRMERFAGKVIDISSFLDRVLEVKPEAFQGTADKTAYHSPCHLCRGLKVTSPPRTLIETAGLTYCPSEEEDVCCGFGGQFSTRFPEISEQILNKKLENIQAGGAGLIVTDCPGCVMQIRGGMMKQGIPVEVKHITEVLADRLKQ